MVINGNTALCCGPTINGQGWGFDWHGRASVLPTKAKAREVLRRNFYPEIIAQCKTARVRDFAELVPDADGRGRIFFRAEPKSSRRTAGTLRKELEKELEKAEEDLQETQREARSLRWALRALGELESAT